MSVLSERVAVITGGASGMGRATVLRFLAEGARVVVADLNESNGAQLLAEIEATHGADRARFVRTDVAEEADVERMIAVAVGEFGGVDVVFNNAGVGGAFGPLTEIGVDDWDRTFAVLVRSVFAGTKHAARVMIEQGRGGSIINTASIAGLIGSPEIPAYTASKHAVIGLTKSAAIDCTGTAVRVNCVCPGLIDSRMLSAIIEGRNPGNAPVPNDKVVERIPARRLGLATEVASVVAFLASDEASYVTGSAYTVDGGRTSA